MNKIELYLVKSSSGKWDDYREYVEPFVYATAQAAEAKRQQIIDDHTEKPFPFDGIDMFFGDTYWFVGKRWLGANSKEAIPVTINDKWDINKKSDVTYGILENAQKELIQKVYIVTNVELGWDNIVFVSFDKAEAEKCKNSWGDTCVIHTKRIEEKFIED